MTNHPAKTNILFVEDEPKVAASVKSWLEENDCQVDIAPDGAVGRHLATSKNYDVVLLDLNLPFVNGYEVCRTVRLEQPDLPVIMVTAMGGVEQKINGFDAGADDYLVKPFEFRELLARIKALLKRSVQHKKTASNHPDDLLVVADLELSPSFKSVRRAGQDIELTAKEFSLLEYLMRLEGRIASRFELIEKVWDVNFDTGTNVVEVYINFLRKKIDRNFEPKLIHTRPGMGYFLKAI